VNGRKGRIKMFGFGEKKEEKKEVVEFNRGWFRWFTVEDCISKALKTDDGILFPLTDGVNMEVRKSTRGGNDFGSLNVCGFIINVTYPLGKNGHFIAFPQYARKGGFSNHALCVDKDFHELVKNLLAILYEENHEEGSGEEVK
jgi:hypothetical protein